MWSDKIPKNINIHSLKVKMIITIFLCFLFIITFSLFNSVMAARIIKNKTNTSLLRTVEQTNRYLNFLFKKAKDIGFSISVNQSLVDLSRAVYSKDSYSFYTTIDNLYKNIMYQAEINSEIDTIFVYIDCIQYLITSKYGMYTYQNMKNTLWAKIVFNMEGKYGWINKYSDEEFNNISNTPRNSLLTFIIRADKINKNIETPAYVSIHFRESDILKIMSSIKVTPGTTAYIVSNNKILVAEDRNMLDKTFDEIIGINAENIENQRFLKLKLDNKNTYQVVFEKNEVINGGLLVLIPEKELLEEQKRLRIFVFFLVSLIAFFFIYFVLKLVIEYVDKPVTKLTKYMQMAERGDFDSKINEKRKDEFGYLYKSYNQMVDRIKKLIEELYEQKLIRTEMEVKALQKQINPHFLYNTLEIVNWIAKVNNIDSISKIVISLSNMYRITFNEGKDLIKIRDMIYGVRCYLDIQKIRFGESFSYEINLRPEIEDYFILNLIVQTIVENAVIHGIDEGSPGGLIKITGYSEKDDVCFIIEDNGRGMNEEKLQLILANINSQNVVSDSGLRNVQKRIKLLYGDNYGISIESSLNKGTRVLLRVPVIKEPVLEEISEGGNLE
ncbi:MAG: sensor histidine kinase [Firmicutes bacterium]|nr:sensor histidine kinase [Bacillota bacterium]